MVVGQANLAAFDSGESLGAIVTLRVVGGAEDAKTPV